MVRHTFFSFHYVRDVMRAQIVKNAWVTKDRVEAGFFDKSAFEAAKRVDGDSLKRFLTRKLRGTSVTCVCVGAKTYDRPWVRYEIFRSVQLGKGMLGVRLDQVPCAKAKRAGLPAFEKSGPSPFGRLGLQINQGWVSWMRWNGAKWISYVGVSSVWAGDLPYDFGGKTAMKLSELFPTYQYNPSTDHVRLGAWIERAAKEAGR